MAAAAFGRAFFVVKTGLVACLAVGVENIFGLLQFGVGEITVMAGGALQGCAVGHGPDRFS